MVWLRQWNKTQKYHLVQQIAQSCVFKALPTNSLTGDSEWSATYIKFMNRQEIRILQLLVVVVNSVSVNKA